MGYLNIFTSIVTYNTDPVCQDTCLSDNPSLMTIIPGICDSNLLCLKAEFGLSAVGSLLTITCQRKADGVLQE